MADTHRAPAGVALICERTLYAHHGFCGGSLQEGTRLTVQRRAEKIALRRVADIEF